jgi:hypothetical protein
MKNMLVLSLLFLGIKKVQSQLIVMNDKMNIVYYGVDNPISFSVNGYNSKQLLLKASCGELRKTPDGYVWKICGTNAGRVSFTATFKKGNKIINLGQSDYRIKNIPDPVIILGPSRHGPHRNNLHNLQSVRLELWNFEFDTRFLVTQFDVEIYKKESSTLVFHNTGYMIGEEARKEISKLPNGDSICIKNVFFKIADCDLEDRRLQDSFCVSYYEPKN